ncbi:GIY-YIG nuclease family protein [Candidatus Nanohalococcus occultus]|uniref:Uri superfamily endonuclease n=1 Tax=Candidatus Nanohalococcus occultus TaxID=2978047 RepID=A0ABY8CJX7_9ARCH|nr:Uri superfamily endonuclease [Candidatus Nanohaloarchaeota archaeon SVXNc]
MKAVYAAFFRLEKSREIEVGALGKIQFPEGIYVYVGSAMNSVEKRLERHFSRTENKHWHIDYFSAVAQPIDYFILPENSSYECVLSETANAIGEPVDSFGSSDCECKTHLYRIKNR